MYVTEAFVLIFTVIIPIYSSEISFPQKRNGADEILEEERMIKSMPTKIGCIDMRSTDGDYYYKSDGRPEVCGLYLIGDPDTLVELEITLDIECNENNIVAVVDGWELQGQYFPSPMDHERSLETRYVDICRLTKPHKKYISSQNVALIQFLIMSEDQGFHVRVNFLPNPEPCNSVAMINSGMMTLKSYGKRSNCSISIIYPEKIYLVNVDIGTSSERSNSRTRSGLSVQVGDKSMECSNADGKSDYVEFLYGDGLDTDLMGRKLAFCGLRSKASKRGIIMGCQHSVIRLVSSGDYYNSITFAYESPTSEELLANNDLC